MQTTAPAPQDQPLNLLADWISREQLAGELGLTRDTPCTRIGRKVYYRRASVEAWINAQEQSRPAARTRRGRK